MQTFDGFQLHDDAVVDEQIQLEPGADALSFVVERNVALAVDSEVCPFHFDDQTFPVH